MGWPALKIVVGERVGIDVERPSQRRSPVVGSTPALRIASDSLMRSSTTARHHLIRISFTSAILVCAVAASGLLAQGSVAQTSAPQSAGLRIVVIEGEGAVNILQQKTAVAPIVEIRDRNNLPVSGAAVTFTLSGGNTATFAGGLQTLTVTTNAAGRAAVSALNPLGAGAVQINVSAAFQGQTVMTVIAQTNVLTAAEAVASSGAVTATGGTAGGGGLSGGAIAGIAGGAAAAALGAVLAATGTEAEAPPGPVTTTYTGSYTGQGAITFTTFFGGDRTGVCVHTRNLNGTLTMTLEQQPDGTVTGTAMTTTVETVTAVSTGCNPANMVIGSSRPEGWNLPVTGNVQALTFTGQHPYTSVPFSGGTVTGSRALAFSGGLAGGVVSGTMTLTDTADGTTLGSPLTWRGFTTLTVTVR